MRQLLFSSKRTVREFCVISPKPLGSHQIRHFAQKCFAPISPSSGEIILLPLWENANVLSMRVIAKFKLRRFWESNPKYRDAKKQMTEWYNYCAAAKWHTPHKLKADLRNASILKNNRVVFNICGNKYRIVTLMDYTRYGMLIRFVGTHEQYDEIGKIGNIEHI